VEYTIGAGSIADTAAYTQFIIDLYRIITVSVEAIGFADCLFWTMVDTESTFFASFSLNFDFHN